MSDQFFNFVPYAYYCLYFPLDPPNRVVPISFRFSPASVSASSRGDLTLPQFALRSLVLNAEASANDVYRFAADSADAIAVEQQYSKFKVCIGVRCDKRIVLKIISL